eukprot:10137_5
MAKSHSRYSTFWTRLIQKTVSTPSLFPHPVVDSRQISRLAPWETVSMNMRLNSFIKPETRSTWTCTANRQRELESTFCRKPPQAAHIFATWTEEGKHTKWIIWLASHRPCLRLVQNSLEMKHKPIYKLRSWQKLATKCTNVKPLVLPRIHPYCRWQGFCERSRPQSSSSRNRVILCALETNTQSEIPRLGMGGFPGFEICSGLRLCWNSRRDI